MQRAKYKKVSYRERLSLIYHWSVFASGQVRFGDLMWHHSSKSKEYRFFSELRKRFSNSQKSSLRLSIEQEEIEKLRFQLMRDREAIMVRSSFFHSH